MDTQNSLKSEDKDFIRRLSRVLVNNHVVVGNTRCLPIKAKAPHDDNLPIFKEYLIEEIGSVNGHLPVEVKVVSCSYSGFSIDLGNYIEKNIIPQEQNNFGSEGHPDMDLIKQSFLRRIGGSPALEKTGGKLPLNFKLNQFVEVYAEGVLYHAREFRKFSIPYAEFNNSLETTVSKKLEIGIQQVRYLGQVMRGELVGLDYLSGRDYNFSDVKFLAKTLLSKCEQRLNHRMSWMNEYSSSKTREVVKSDWILKYELEHPLGNESAGAIKIYRPSEKRDTELDLGKIVEKRREPVQYAQIESFENWASRVIGKK